MSDAHGVARFEAATGVQFPAINAARALTERRLAERRDRFASIGDDGGATVLLMGSWGRREITSESDDDFMVLVDGELGDRALPTIQDVAAALGSRPPGHEEVFGVQVALDDLRGKIGRQDDTNANLTRRMLFLLESVAVCGEATYLRARRSLLAGYLEANVKDYRPPRFLLNDVIRYWRTIAVDFESKMRDRKGEGWGLRNAKLRLSRKALFAGGLLPVLECYRYRSDAMLDFLDERMSVPPLDRIADAFFEHGAIGPGIRALAAYDEFLAILDDPAKRAELAKLAVDAHDSALFARIAELGQDFEAGLLSLLFDDPDLRRRVREYVIF